MLSRSRKGALVVLPVMLAIATTTAIVVISESYHDSNHRWTAIAAVLAGSALLAALDGLPIALFRLFVVERDIAQLDLVHSMHYAQLRGMLEGSQLALGRQARFEFGDQPDGRQLFRDAFFGHFPELSKCAATGQSCRPASSTRARSGRKRRSVVVRPRRRRRSPRRAGARCVRAILPPSARRRARSA